MLVFCQSVYVYYPFKIHKKAPSARVGIAGGAVLPFNPPWGMRNYLEGIADVRWLKGISIHTMPANEYGLRDGG